MFNTKVMRLGALWFIMSNIENLCWLTWQEVSAKNVCWVLILVVVDSDLFNKLTQSQDHLFTGVRGGSGRSNSCHVLTSDGAHDRLQPQSGTVVAKRYLCKLRSRTRLFEEFKIWCWVLNSRWSANCFSLVQTFFRKGLGLDIATEAG